MEDSREYQIRLWGADRTLLCVVPTLRISEQEAKSRALELLSLHGGTSFTLEPQLPEAPITRLI
jgi:hypothetical protein